MFDRTMIYQFDDSWNGRVVAEQVILSCRFPIRFPHSSLRRSTGARRRICTVGSTSPLPTFRRKLESCIGSIKFDVCTIEIPRPLECVVALAQKFVAFLCVAGFSWRCC